MIHLYHSSLFGAVLISLVDQRTISVVDDPDTRYTAYDIPPSARKSPEVITVFDELQLRLRVSRAPTVNYFLISRYENRRRKNMVI